MVLRAWRITKTKHAGQAFDGEGAKRYSGRWNSLGTALVYTSETLALATLEILVRLQDSSPLRAYTAFPVRFDDELVRVLDQSELPHNWAQIPAPPELQRVGDEWVKSQQSVLLRVPSVIIPMEWNYLINPAHPDFKRVEIGKQQPLELDPRLTRPKEPTDLTG